MRSKPRTRRGYAGERGPKAERTVARSHMRERGPDDERAVAHSHMGSHMEAETFATFAVYLSRCPTGELSGRATLFAPS